MSLKSPKSLSILLVSNQRSAVSALMADHIQALLRHSRHWIYPIDPQALQEEGGFDFSDYDAIAFDQTVSVQQDDVIPQRIREEIGQFPGLKVLFAHDTFQDIDAICAAIRQMKVGVVFTRVPESQFERVLGQRLPEVRLVNWIGGCISERLAQTNSPLLRDRPIDVGCWASPTPPWLGKLADSRFSSGQKLQEHLSGSGLKHEVYPLTYQSQNARAKTDFFRSCKAMYLSGMAASIVDFDGHVEQSVRQYLSDHPNATFEQVSQDVLQPYEGNAHIDILSLELLKAIALRTALILVPGEYSGILSPWTHYIPLEHDLSNIKDVIEAIRDTAALGGMAKRTYHDVVKSGLFSCRHAVKVFDDLIDAHFTGAPHRRLPKPSFWVARVRSLLRPR